MGSRVSSRHENIRVLLADESLLFREALRGALNKYQGIEVAGDAYDGETAVAQVDLCRPDVALIDADMRGRLDGLEAAQLISHHVPDCRVVMLATEANETLLDQSLAVGATGFQTKECLIPDLLDTIRAVHQGLTSVPQELLGPLINRLNGRLAERDLARREITRLSHREKQVLHHLVCGDNNGTVGRALGISPATVRTHIQNLLSKLGFHSRLEAVAFVTRHGAHEELTVARTLEA